MKPRFEQFYIERLKGTHIVYLWGLGVWALLIGVLLIEPF
jgi:hypothetical protein